MRNDPETGAIPTLERPGARRSVTIPSWKTLSLTLALAGCGVNSQPLAGPSVEMSVRGAHQCVPEATPLGLPRPESLLDVDRLGGHLSALFEEGGVEGGEAVLTLWYDAGVNTRRDLLSHDLPPAVADSLQRLVFATLREEFRPEIAWGARLRIRAGDRVGFALEPRQYCPPRPRNTGLESAMAEFVTTGVRYRRGNRERSVVLGVTVHPQGYVRSARIVRGAASGGTLERQLAEYVRQFFFDPASLDGIPVQGELAVPVRLQG